jgi:hypothetical protein
MRPALMAVLSYHAVRRAAAAREDAANIVYKRSAIFWREGRLVKRQWEPEEER